MSNETGTDSWEAIPSVIGWGGLATGVVQQSLRLVEESSWTGRLLGKEAAAAAGLLAKWRGFQAASLVGTAFMGWNALTAGERLFAKRKATIAGMMA